MNETSTGNDSSQAEAGLPLPEGESSAPNRKRLRWPFWLTLGAVVTVLGVIVVPNFITARTTACHNSCIANLKMIDGGVQQWALENKKTSTDLPTASEVAFYLKGNQLPTCPEHGVYTLHTVSENPTCTIPGHSL